MKNRKFEKILISLLILIEISFLFIQTFHQPLQNDENEHLYNAYMIFLGNIPYLDFFEHHNPLMWYIISPLYNIYENNINIYYIVRLFMFICVLITGIFTYKIAKKLSFSDFYSLLSVCFYFSFNTLKTTGIQFRPDTPMTLFIIIGIYYLITYITKKQNNKDIYLSIISFSISFWFLQKSIVFIIPTIIFILILLFLKKVSWYNVILASFLTLFVSLIYIFYLYNNDCLNLYYIYNYIGNIENTRKYTIFKENSYFNTYKDKTILLCIIMCILSFFINIKQNKKISILSFYTIVSFIFLTHGLYGVNKHYLLPLLPLFSIISTDILQIIINKKIFKIPFLFFFIIQQIYFDYNIIKNTHIPFNTYIKINKYITNNTSNNDEVLIHVSITGIKKQAEGYYYFGEQYIIDNIYNIIPYKKLPNKKEIIINKKPKIIFDNFYADEELYHFIIKNYIPKQIEGLTFLIKKQ